MKHIGETETVERRPGQFVEKHLPPFECPTCTEVVFWEFEYNVPGWGDVGWQVVHAATDGMYYGVKYDYRADEGGWIPASEYTEDYPDIEQVKRAIDNARQWDQEDQFDASKGGIPW
jgi:hypothetical protein